MNKFNIKDYFVDPENKISKRILYKSDNVIVFMLNIAKGEILPAHTHLTSTLLLQVMEGSALVTTDGKQTPLNIEELMQIDGSESLQVLNSGDNILRLLVSISPMGSEDFANDGDF